MKLTQEEGDPMDVRPYSADPIPWLLEAGEPWVRYHTLLALLDRAEDDPDAIRR
jgi:hypothetical protein